ncbi:hypothetical protein EVAR_75765_1 [Eumeta japonica]|uniref:Uncharacterized protein n=1 Tax=Eumeta variegata TaxID=151549 RepID=A0A4C1TDN6_EUMVA|nr:hypothetical protein EVAR_75765_1 [Eumeta japonica]
MVRVESISILKMSTQLLLQTATLQAICPRHSDIIGTSTDAQWPASAQKRCRYLHYIGYTHSVDFVTRNMRVRCPILRRENECGRTDDRSRTLSGRGRIFDVQTLRTLVSNLALKFCNEFWG